jgi:hypothetical protein
MPTPGSSIGGTYREAAAHYAAGRDRERRRSRWISYARLGVFVSAAACTVSAFPGATDGFAVRVGAGAAGFAAYFALVYWHSRVERAEQWLATLSQVNDEAAARVGREWARLPPPEVAGPPASHAYAADLDLFGPASLYQLLGWTGTEVGRQTLAAWLAASASPEVILARQRAVAELAPLTALRERVAALGRLVEPARRDLEEFFSWVDGGPWLRKMPWLRWLARVTSGLTVGLLGLQLAGQVERPLWLVPLMPALALFGLFERRIHATFRRAFSRDRLFQQHSSLFSCITETRFEARHLQDLQAGLRRSGLSAVREMERLATIRQFADLRFVALFHVVIALVTLWDFHVLSSLERWQVRTAGHVRRWFDVLGEFDALAALAALAHDNPGWAFPAVVEGSDRVEARALAHPLLPDDRRVPNDVEVGPPGRFLLVTGSNMSGKSTLLRAVGVNVVLAQAGGPVCAESMALPPLALCTSMRIQDSLAEGVSSFMAALQRLALVVFSARAVPAEGPMLLYLLDEVLQGTNTAERQVAVRLVLGHLLSLRAIGVVTTHDLDLAACDELSAACEAVHFTEGVEHVGEGARLSFDYRIRPGVATSRNALTLLRLVGLGPG